MTFKVTKSKQSYYVMAVGFLHAHVLETILADPEFGHFSILFWVWTEVPGIYLVLAHLNFVNVLDFGNGFMLLFKRSSGGIHFSICLQSHF